MNKMIWSCALILIFLFCGCGLSNVVNRGEYIDQTSIQPGTPRKECLARFGSPIDNKSDKDGCKMDVFRVPQGEKTSGKAIKGTGMLVADVLTLGLTEIIFTPVTDGKQYVTFEIFYDKDERVKEVKFIQR
jgi:hypothetical protein